MADSLKHLNTFGIDVACTRIIEIQSIEDLENLEYQNHDEFLILGGGSNIVFTEDLDKPILLNKIKTKEVLSESPDEVILKVGGGENWHDLVLWTLTKNFAGLENLSLIPGTVGAAPIQNIGAYGVEVKDHLLEVHAYDMFEGILKKFDAASCAFGYRDSIFKHPPAKGRFFISHVVFKLSKDIYDVKTSYGAISDTLLKKGIVKPTIQDVSESVIEIRQSKLPDPSVLGNSGSFFKNPIIIRSRYEDLLSRFPKMPAYTMSESKVKIPAAWLIDQCGWKGSKIGNVGNYHQQALIIVNYGGGTGNDVITHAKNIQQSVHDIFNIDLEFEVNVI